MKVAIITGATRGIGAAVAKSMSLEGYQLVLNYRTMQPEFEAFVKTLPSETLLVQGDVSQFDEAQNIIKQTIEHFGRVDVLVNNAGITRDNLILRLSEEEFDQVYETNLKGTFNMTKHISRIMLKQKYGRIINMSSVIGLKGNIGQSNYAASKAGVIGLTKSIAKELASKGITVNAVAPGFIETQMTESISDEAKNAALQNIPMKRLGVPEDIAHIVCFLASDQANYITGQVIQVDGGMAI